MELLRGGDDGALAVLVREERGALPWLVGHLWDGDRALRERAARAVGIAASAHPDLGLEVVRRLLWALNDEAGTNGVYGVEALGEIGAASPELIGPALGPLVSYLADDGLRTELLGALGRIAVAAPEAVLPHREAIVCGPAPATARQRALRERLLAALDRGEHGED